MQSARDEIEQLLSSETLARQMRSGYKTYFYAPAFCAATAVFFAAQREWIYAAGSTLSALLYFPVSLAQYRSSKKICEEVLQRYER